MTAFELVTWPTPVEVAVREKVSETGTECVCPTPVVCPDNWI